MVEVTGIWANHLPFNGDRYSRSPRLLPIAEASLRFQKWGVRDRAYLKEKNLKPGGEQKNCALPTSSYVAFSLKVTAMYDEFNWLISF
jgi:hypothetical protein